jgi:hypothetical protein
LAGGSSVEHQASASRLQDPFDYEAEDQLIDRWLATVAGFEPVTFSSEPGFGGAYYGRTPNPATGISRVEQIEPRP